MERWSLNGSSPLRAAARDPPNLCMLLVGAFVMGLDSKYDEFLDGSQVSGAGQLLGIDFKCKPNATGGCDYSGLPLLNAPKLRFNWTTSSFGNVGA